MVELGGDCVRFPLKIRILRSRKSIFPDEIGTGETFFNVSHVNVDVDIDVVGIDLVELGRAGRERILDGKDGRERLVGDVNERERFQCRVFIDGSYGSHFFAHITDLLGGKKLLVLGVFKNSPFVAARILCREDGFYAREFFRLCGIDRHDPRVGMRRTQYLPYEHSRQCKVGREEGFARCLRGRVDPFHIFSDIGKFFHGLPSLLGE